VSGRAARLRRGGRKQLLPTIPVIEVLPNTVNAGIADGAVPAQPDYDAHWKCYYAESPIGNPTTHPQLWQDQGVGDAAEPEFATWTEVEPEYYVIARYYGGGEWSPWSEILQAV
jgi:hypothetical protein